MLKLGKKTHEFALVFRLSRHPRPAHIIFNIHGGARALVSSFPETDRSRPLISSGKWKKELKPDPSSSPILPCLLTKRHEYALGPSMHRDRVLFTVSSHVPTHSTARFCPGWDLF